jgi:hypothetical protein
MPAHAISMEVETPLGRGQSLFVETGEDDAFWTVAMRDNGAIVTFRQSKIRASRSYTLGRMISDQQMRDIIKLAS